MAVHGLEEMQAPFVVVEYCGSFKLVRSERLRPIGIKSVITILSFITILEDGRGVFCARYVRHDPQYSDVNGLLRSWNLIDDGPTFEIISERDTCCQCKLFFNTTRDFAYHF